MGRASPTPHQSDRQEAPDELLCQICRLCRQMLIVRAALPSDPMRRMGAVSPSVCDTPILRQVLRYHWGGQVLWQMSQGQATEPPPCPRCNAPRCFEAQVMPALLYHLDVEAHAPPGDEVRFVLRVCWVCV